MNATTTQQDDLKALAQRVLVRNSARNSSATAPENPCNKQGNLRALLEGACNNLPVTTAELRARLADHDLDDLKAGRVTPAAIRHFAELVAPRIERPLWPEDCQEARR